MAERIPKKEGSPRNRLESWLVRKIQGGGLKSMQRFRPMGGRASQCPEQYARTLLASLRSTHDNAREVERLKDDGRSFRSWVESSQIPAARSTDALGNSRPQHGSFA